MLIHFAVYLSQALTTKQQFMLFFFTKWFLTFVPWVTEAIHFSGTPDHLSSVILTIIGF